MLNESLDNRLINKLQSDDASEFPKQETLKSSQLQNLRNTSHKVTDSVDFMKHLQNLQDNNINDLLSSFV